MRRFSRLLIGVAAVAFIGECIAGLRGDVQRLCCAPLQQSWGLLLGAVILSLTNYALRIVRWRYYLAKLGFRFPLGFSALAYIAGFAFTVSPGKVGEMVRARYYSRRAVPMSAVGGVFCVERLLDVLAMIVLAALILADAPRYHAAIWTAAVLVAAVLVVLAVLPWSTVAARLEGHSALSGDPVRPGVARLAAISRFCAGMAKAFAAARSLLQPRALFFGFVAGLCAWALEGLGLCLLAMMLPPGHVDPMIGVGIYGVAVLAGALSFLPGGLGSTEAVMAALLVTHGYPFDNALLVTLACRLVTLWFAVGCGWAAVAALRERLATSPVPGQ